MMQPQIPLKAHMTVQNAFKMTVEVLVKANKEFMKQGLRIKLFY
jgi:hypothetical protein